MESGTKQDKPRLPWGRLALGILPALLFFLCAWAHRTDPAAALFYVGLGFAVSGMIIGGCLAISRGTRRKLPYVSVAAGTIAAVILAIPILMTGAFLEPMTKRYDYRQELSKLCSVEYVQVTKLANTEDEMAYRVLRSVPREEWPELLDQIAEIEFFHPYNDPPTWTAGEQMFLIRFSVPSEDGTRFALIGYLCPWIGEKDGDLVRIRVDSGFECSYGQDWKALSEKFGAGR